MRRLLSVFPLLFLTSGLFAQAPHAERIYLSGRGTDDAVMWDFRCSAGQNSGVWRKIAVPCNWELQGFGDYTYGRWYTVKGPRRAPRRASIGAVSTLRPPGAAGG